MDEPLFLVLCGLSASLFTFFIGLVMLDAFEDAPRHEPNAGGE